MSIVAWTTLALVTAVVLVAAAANYRKHARRARAKSEAALATLLAETEQIAAEARVRNSQPGLADQIDAADVAADTAKAPKPARPYEPDPVREAYERGYRQGFLDGMAGSKNQPRY